MKKQRRWFVRRKSDNRILCIDGLWRNNAGSVYCIKFYKRDSNAIKFGLNYNDGTAFAVYDGDVLDCTGCINNRATRSW
jgi:hypothetical protein